MGTGNLVSLSAQIHHHSAPLGHSPNTTVHIARPCYSSTQIRRNCTRSLAHLPPLTSRSEGSKLVCSGSDGVLPASGSDDDDVPFGGGSGGGGGGDGGQGNAGNSDGENTLPQLLKQKSTGVDKTLRILTVSGQIARKVKLEVEKTPVLGNMTGFHTSIPQDVELSALGVLNKEFPECTSLGDSSSSSMDNLQRTSSTDLSSSMVTVSMDVGRIHSSDDNNNYESIRPASNCPLFENYAATNLGHRRLYEMRNQETTIPRLMDTSSVRNAFEENVKGFLTPINSVTALLCTTSLTLDALAFAYPFTSKANLRSDDNWMQVISAGSAIDVIASIILACLVFRLKARKSIQGAGFQTVKYLILLYPLVLVAKMCIFLHFALKVNKVLAWIIGAIGYIAILSIWALIYYVDHPQILKGMRNDTVEDGAFSSPV